MISPYRWTLHFFHDLDTFVGVRVVTNDVAKADEMRAVALTCVGQHGFRCLEIGVQVAKNREAHGRVVKKVKKVKKFTTLNGRTIHNLTI